jgi:hypothetical protein
LTCAIKRRFISGAGCRLPGKCLLVAVLAGICGSAHAAEPAFTFTNEITSNDIYGLAGHGDTLWMATNWGINFTIAKTETPTWAGYKSDQGRFNGALGFGSGRLLAALVSEQSDKNSSVVFNKLWLYSHASGNSGSYKVLQPGFEDADHLDSLEKSTNFSVADILWTNNHFWLACLDGGLVRYDIDGDSMQAFFPGKTAGFKPSAFTKSIDGALSGYPDTSRNSRQRVIAVDAANPLSVSPSLWVATPAKLWNYKPQEKAWDSLPSSLTDNKMIFQSYQNVYVDGAGDSSGLYAAIKFKKETQKIDTIGFFKYDTSVQAWKVLVENLENVPPASFGPSGEIYLSFGNQVHLYTDTNGALTTVWSGDIFQKRMTQATGGDYPNFINDILCLPRPDGKVALWIASSTTSLPTNNGLFFSLDEKRDERDTAAFYYVHRDKKLTGALKQSYAYPGILNASNGGKAVFAYNLSKASKVTIRIFDWNMDPVKTVIKSKDRPAGNDRSNGRSTNAAEDVWDGTTDSGRRVAAGVYYYKITAQSGEHSFGKIIVAH